MVIAHRAFGTISFYSLHPLNPTGKISNPTGNLSNPTNISPTPSTLQQPQQHIRITPLKSNAFNGDVTGGRYCNENTMSFWTEMAVIHHFPTNTSIVVCLREFVKPWRDLSSCSDTIQASFSFV